MRTRTVLLFIVLAAALFGTTGTEVQDLSQGGCKEILGETCSKSATPLDVACSVIGFVGSATVIMFPGWHVWRMLHGPEDIMSDRWFMCFLLIGTYDYAAWVLYAFRECGYCDVTPYMKGSSVLGFVCFLIFSVIGLAKDKGRITRIEVQVDSPVFIFTCVVSGGIAIGGVHNSDDVTFWMFVALTLLAQLCRIIAMDYSDFSTLQCCVSIAGVCGILCIRHPHVVATDPYWFSVFCVAVVRLFDCMAWLAAYLGVNPSPRRFFKYASDHNR